MSQSASAKSAQRQMDFQQEMSSTAHQREVADLRAAGLNPILSASGGPGASTPSGSSYEGRDVISPAVNSGLSVYKGKQSVDLMKQQAEQAETASSVNRSQVFLNMGLADKAAAEAQLARVNAGRAETETQATALGFPNIPVQGNLMKAQEQAARASAVQNLSQSDLNVVQSKLAAANINLTNAQIGQVIQLIARGEGDAAMSQILADYFRTDIGRANVIGKTIKDALPSLGDVLKLPKVGK